MARVILREWSIVIQAEVPPRPERITQGRVCAIDLGWRKSAKNIRVAFVSSETESYPIHCPLVYADRSIRRHNDALRGVGYAGRIPIPTTLNETRQLAELLSRRFDEMKTAVGETLAEKPVGWAKMRERRIGRLARDEITGDHPAVAIYNEWADFHYPRRRILTRAVQRMHNSRTKAYERYVAELCRNYDEIRIEDVSVSQIIRNSIEKRKIKETDDDETRSKKRRERSSSKYRQFAAPAEFIAILRRTAERTGVRIVEMDARFTTRTCCNCGHKRAKDAGRLLTCESCAKTVDRDLCATRNMLSPNWPLSNKKKRKSETVRID